MKYILFNPLANNKQGEKPVKEIESKLKDNYTTKSLIDISIKDFFSSLKEDDEVILVGGDGTLNRLINALDDKIPNNKIYLYKAGSGNDFLRDVNKDNEDFFLLNDYLNNLPTVTVNNKTSYFINGIGYGIDGYCCEVGDKLKLKSDKPINYAGIAIKGLLFHFKKVNAKVTVDGVTTEYKKVWLAPTMKGRFYGGGMMIAPNQDRKSGLLTNVIYKTGSKLKALMVFPTIFKGTHINNKKMVIISTGNHIKVEFDRPCALQIDGETVLNVTSYEVNI